LVEIFKSAVFDWVSGGSIAHLDTNVDQIVDRERERERDRERSSCFYSSYFWYFMFLLSFFFSLLVIKLGGFLVLGIVPNLKSI